MQTQTCCRRSPISPMSEIVESSMCARRPGTQPEGFHRSARAGRSLLRGSVLPYGERARARNWGRSMPRVPLAYVRSAQTELLDVAVQVLGERPCVGTQLS